MAEVIERMRRLVMDQKETAQLIGMTQRYLEGLRYRGGGPQYLKLGNRVAYRLEDVQTWLAGQRRTSTSDTGTK
jgi:predicted DNA-binding transcriptional regulator AlpA